MYNFIFYFTCLNLPCTWQCLVHNKQILFTVWMPEQCKFSCMRKIGKLPDILDKSKLPIHHSWLSVCFVPFVNPRSSTVLFLFSTQSLFCRDHPLLVATRCEAMLMRLIVLLITFEWRTNWPIPVIFLFHCFSLYFLVFLFFQWLFFMRIIVHLTPFEWRTDWPIP